MITWDGWHLKAGAGDTAWAADDKKQQATDTKGANVHSFQ